MVNEEQNSQWYTEARMRELLAEKDAAVADLCAKIEALAVEWEGIADLHASEDHKESIYTAEGAMECDTEERSYADAASRLRAVLEGGR